MRHRNAAVTAGDLPDLAWDKMDGLLPAIVQHAHSGEVLMLGYMDRAALEATLESGRATFFSRSKQRLWQKGETSGNHLAVTAVRTDCDADALLLLAEPAGPVCHTGSPSCFGEEGAPGIGWLENLAGTISARAADAGAGGYTRSLLDAGALRIAQKVGEEGVELALAGAARGPADCVEEAADLLYHVSVLMEARGFSWSEVAEALKRRHLPSPLKGAG